VLMRSVSTGSPAVSVSSAHHSSGCIRGVARRSSAGFTLLEAMIAIVVLALSLSVLMPSYGTGLRSIAAVDDHLRARALAQSVLAEWSHNRSLRPGMVDGSYDKFTWTLSVTPMDDPPLPGSNASQWTLYELVLRVSWPKNRQIELHTALMGLRR
jgi:general secretion pathway protein I